VSAVSARHPRGRLPERLDHDLGQQPEPNGYTLGAAILDPPEIEGLGLFYIPVLGRSGLLATLLPWPDGSESCVAISTHLLQELIEEDVEIWPRCPGHDHALVPKVVESVVSWTCPIDEARHWRIGDLPSANADTD